MQLEELRRVLETRCSHHSCKSRALVLSDPPLCGHHIPDPDMWYGSLAAKAREMGLDPNQQMMISAMAETSYKYDALLRDPVARRLNEELDEGFYRKTGAAASFDDLVFFVLTAAASGILGNLAYDALRALCRRIAKGRESDVDETIDFAVTYERYERHRLEHSGGKNPARSLKQEAVLKLRTRYNLLVRKRRG